MAWSRDNSLPAAAGKRPPATGQQLYLMFNHSCIIYNLRVLDAEITRLEDGLSCLGLLKEVLGSSYCSTRSSLLDEIFRIRAKRDRIYEEFKRNRHTLECLRNDVQINEVGSPASANSRT